MGRRSVQVVILCEDRKQERFFRRLCQRLGHRLIDVRVAPSGEGSAAQWVAQNYPAEVQAHRAKANFISRGLVVAIDGDAWGVEVRKQELDEALREAAMERRQGRERIALCVPTWSIETWLAFLCGQKGINEQTRYKRDIQYQAAEDAELISPRKAVEGWVKSPGSDEAVVLPSLHDGRKELDRLLAI